MSSLDFESLLSKDHRPAKLTQMVSREKFKPSKNGSKNKTISKNDNQSGSGAKKVGGGASGVGGEDNSLLLNDGSTTNGAINGTHLQAVTEETSLLLRTLVSKTPTFSKHGYGNSSESSNTSDDEDNNNSNNESNFMKNEFAALAKLFAKNKNKKKKNAITDSYLGNNRTTTQNGVITTSSSGPSLFTDLPHSLHQVEMGDWEKNIEWDGCCDSNDDNGDGNNNNALSEASVNKNNDTTTSSGMVAASNANGITSSDNNANSLQRHIHNTNSAILLKQRRNPCLDNLSLDFICWEGTGNGDNSNNSNGESSSFKPKVIVAPLVLELGIAGQSVARHILPPQRPIPGIKTEAYRRRVELEWSGTSGITSTAEISKSVTGGGSLHADREKMEALIKARQRKRAQMAKDKTNRVTEAMGTLAMGGGKGRTITSSLMGPGGTERTGRPSRHMGSSAAHEYDYVEQLDMVCNHSLVRDLSKVSLRQYHRPKVPLSIARTSLSWKLHIRYIPSSKKGGVDGAGGGLFGGMNNASMMGAGGLHGAQFAGAVSKVKLRNEADLSPSEGKLVLLEYCEERPPIQLTKGMASKIVNYFRGDKARCPVSAGGGDRPTRRKNRSSNNDKDNGDDREKDSINKDDKYKSSLLGSKPPPLDGPDRALNATAMDWIGKLPKKSKEDRNAEKNLIDILPEGVTEVLHPKVHGPFIGEVEEGMTLTGLISNLFVAPMFRHVPESTDFLMILGRNSGGGLSRPGVSDSLGVILRELPTSAFTVGQSEPRTRVNAPNTQNEKNFIGPFVQYQIAKSLARTQQREGHGLRFDEIQVHVLPNLGLPPNALRQRLKQVAIYDKNTQIWTTKAIGYEDYPGVDALGKGISPEGVAAYETTFAASRRLNDLGIHHLLAGSHSVGSVGVAMVYLAGQLNAAKELSKKMKKLNDQSKTVKNMKQTQIMFYEKAAMDVESIFKNLKAKYEVATFIYEELQLAPWHLTGEFIEVHKKGEGTGMMKLTGLGDPSGGTGGFNFLRELDSKPSKSVGQGAINAQIKKITGTEDDLRKLTMKQMASLLRSYGMAQKQIDTLKRWDRVHVIRDLSTKAASDGVGDGLERFARGEKMKLSEQKEMYRNRIQVIWKRQIAALSTDFRSGDGAAGGGVGSSGDGTATGGAGGDGTGDGTDANGNKKPGSDMKMDDSDSESDDDDMVAEFEEEMMDGREANQLVAAHARGANDPLGMGAPGDVRAAVQDQDLTKDARELAALKRQREEERQAREGMLSNTNKSNDNNPSNKPNTNYANRKVIRRRIVKTYPDGRQTTTFKFIVREAEVNKIIAKLENKTTTKTSTKKGAHSKDKQELYKENMKKTFYNTEPIKFEYDRDERPAGHSMFEDEDDFEYVSRSRHLSQKRSRGGTRSRGARGSIGGAFGAATAGAASGGGSTGGRITPRPKTLQYGKLKNSKASTTSKQERMKKRKREEEEAADLYSTSSKRKGTSNRRERGSIRERRPHVIFADKLETMRSTVERRSTAGPFLKPVNRRQIPKYYEVISYPIDLSTIRDKIGRYEYRTADAFLRDFELMKNNAIKYNGNAHEIAKEGVAIYESVKSMIDGNQTELTKLEEAVKEQLSMPKKKKKKKKAGGASSKKGGSSSEKASATASAEKSNSGAAASSTTNNVGIVGGVEVNLGDISLSLNMDDNDSSGDDSFMLG